MNNKNISSWLDKLQQESWNLELLISGFSIFLLLQVGEPITRLSIHFYELINTYWEAGMFAIFLSILKAASYVMVANLLVHVVTRGVWVGMVGLRSVGKIDEIEKLNYSDRFSAYLQKHLTNLDELIIRLDKISSVIFAFTFLLVFMLLSLFIWLGIGSALATVVTKLAVGVPSIMALTYASIVVIFLLCSLLYFLDTLSLGFFKKYKFVSRLYIPVYRFFTLITFSFVYRSIYYHLIARLPKRMVQVILALYIFILVFYPFHTLNYNRFYPDDKSSYVLNSAHYDDLLNTNQLIQVATIPSQIIQTNLFPLFIRYHPRDNQAIAALCTDYSPSKTQSFISGIRFDLNGSVYLGSPTIPEESPKKLLNCLSQFYRVYVDTIPLEEQRFYFDQHVNNGEKGLKTMIRLDSFPPGAHYLNINTKHLVADTILERRYARIPFWKE